MIPPAPPLQTTTISLGRGLVFLYSTVKDFARFLGLSMSHPFSLLSRGGMTGIRASANTCMTFLAPPLQTTTVSLGRGLVFLYSTVTDFARFFGL
jgi:hypothetical protein